MPDSYKIQYGGMTLTYPDWNGYVGYDAMKLINFSAIGNSTAKMYVTATYKGETTSWNNGTSTGVMEIPAGSLINYSAVCDSYYRVKSCVGNNTIDFTSARQSDPKVITGSCVAGNEDGYVSTNATTPNRISWQYSFTRPSNTWTANNGGVYSVDIVPTAGVTNFSSLAGLPMEQCINGGRTYTANGSMLGCSNKSNSQNATATYVGTYINTNGTASKNVWFSAHINLTGRTWHAKGYWTGTANNGGQQGLKANYMTTAGQIQDPGKNVRNDFFNMGNTTRTTSFNLTGANSQVAANYGWGPQCIKVYATLGVANNGTSYASKTPPNQIENVNATVKCSAWVP